MSSYPYRNISVDLDADTLDLELSNGTSKHGSPRDVLEPASATSRPNSRIRAWDVDFLAGKAAMRTDRGDIVTVELFDPSGGDQIRGRRIVYLDQNRWSEVAKAYTQPLRDMAPTVRAAAHTLIDLATDSRIILPVSAAHLRETGALRDERRYETGLTMAKLSRGWQLRHPSDIWQNEITLAVSELVRKDPPSLATAPPVTLEPSAMFSDSQELGSPRSGIGFALEIARWPQILLDTLIDPLPLPPAIPDAWVARQVELSQILRQSPAPRERALKGAIALSLADQSRALYNALELLGMSAAELPELTIDTSTSLLGAHPLTSRYSRIMAQRYLNKMTRWEGNDLTDLMYLTAAAGYADYVGAEKHAGTDLIEVQKSEKTKINVATSLPDLVSILEADQT